MIGTKNKQYAYWVFAILLINLGGCNKLGNNGVNIGYGAWNISTEEVTDVNVGGYFTASRLNAYQHMMPSMGSSLFRDKDVSTVIPEEIQISWRQMPRKGQEWYNSKQFGPYKVKLRTRIPDDVIRKAKQTDYTLNIGLSVGKLPILVCWRLERSADPKPGTVYVQQGGDC